MTSRILSLSTVAVAFIVCSFAITAQIVSQLNPSHAIVSVGGGNSYSPIASPDGRFVVFASSANNLAVVAGGKTAVSHVPAPLNVFLRDRQLGSTTLISVNSTGTGGGNADSYPSALSADGRFVLFESAASDLVPGDTNGVKDIFIRDAGAETTVLVSVGTNGAFGNGESREATMTPDGHYAAFVSHASNLTPNDTNGIADVFVRDLQAGVTTLASVGASPAQIAAPYTGGSSSESPQISADGRFVAFYSTATYLLPKLTNVGEIFVRDVVNNSTSWASSNAHGVFSGAVSASFAMTPDGQFLAYYSAQTGVTGGIFRYHVLASTTDLIASNGYLTTSLDSVERPLDISTNGQLIAFVQTNQSVIPILPGLSIELWNAQSNSILLVSGGATNSHCAFPRLDASGRYVAFVSDEASLTTNSDGSPHVYVRDTATGVVQLADVAPGGGEPFASPTGPISFSGNAALVAWPSPDAAVAANAPKQDVFARDLTGSATEVVSAPSPALGSATAFGSSFLTSSSVSSNGTLVAFASDANGLSPNVTNSFRNIYVHNLLTGSNTLVSVAPDGVTPANGQSFTPAMSASGRYVIFCSAATNLVANDTNGVNDIFVRDLQSNTTTLVSVDVSGQGEGTGNSTAPQLSADGRFALFASASANIVTNKINNTQTNVFYRRDLQQGVTVAISPQGAVAAAMTPDGSAVAWDDTFYGYLWRASYGTNTKVLNVFTESLMQDVAITSDGLTVVYGKGTEIFVADVVTGTNAQLATVVGTSRPRFAFSGDGHYLACLNAVANTNQLYLYDLAAGTNMLVSRAYDGSGASDGSCDSPAFSPDGRYIAYRSFADNLVPGDSNGQPDVFLFDRTSGATTLASVSGVGNYSGNGFSLSPFFSPDSQTLFFQSWASDIAPGDFNQFADIFALPLSAGSPVASTNSFPPLGFSAISFVPGATGAQPNSGLPVLMWSAAPGMGYQVQFKNDLSDPQWQNLEVPATVVGTQGSASDSSPSAPQRFYRIVSF